MTLSVEKITAVPELEFRLEDMRECELGGFSVGGAAKLSLDKSLSSYKVVYEGDVVALWGFAPTSLLGNTAWVWMLSTPHVEQCKHIFAAGSREVMNRLLETYPNLLVNVDPAYGRALRWLRWLGFVEVAHEGPFLQMLIQRKV